MTSNLQSANSAFRDSLEPFRSSAGKLLARALPVGHNSVFARSVCTLPLASPQSMTHSTGDARDSPHAAEDDQTSISD